MMELLATGVVIYGAAGLLLVSDISSWERGGLVVAIGLALTVVWKRYVEVQDKAVANALVLEKLEEIAEAIKAGTGSADALLSALNLRLANLHCPLLDATVAEGTEQRPDRPKQ